MSNSARLSVLGMYMFDNSLFDGLAVPAEWDTDTKDLLVNNLVMDCAELEVVYSDWDFLKLAITAWSEKELITWQRIYNASVLEYNPIENYNRTEDTTVQNSGAVKHTGSDSVQGSGSDSDSFTGSDTDAMSGSDTDAESGYDSDVGSGKDTTENSVTSFDSASYSKHDKTELTAGITHTFNKNTTVTHTKNTTLTQTKNTTVTHTKGAKDTTTYGHIITDTTGSRTTGNISGNIGVTTSQQMLEQELAIAPKLNVINYIIESFKNRFCLLVY